ncbi:hypothetical protein CPAR01_07074 [Colletotrichum paranaense]|uniref:Uncharacterized protein n=1 Tax=Colletotrichum paranaense TaxID=1914294 RepID=A0ABQ9SNY3_9PEZI|nr:uncharacterized protein CPAR01_07074 [Colletotrichum paranaense]KAK1541085.1 hypothetical protein CPAR01_07074 [Colletotrichum paranaense]
MADDAWMAELDDYIMLSVESDSWVNGGFYYIFDVALRKLLRYLFLPYKTSFVRCLQQIQTALWLPDSIRITSDVGDSMTDSFCVGGIACLFIISFIFFMLLAMSTCIKDSRVTISEAFFALEICLGLWWVWGIMERWMLEVGQGDVRMRHHFWR